MQRFLGSVTSCWLAIALVVSWARSPAYACTVDQCQPSVTLPLDGASMPASVSGFLWRKSPDLAPSSEPDYDIQLHAIDETGVASPLELEVVPRSRLVLIKPLGELTPGTRLAFSYMQPRCGRLEEQRVTMAIQVTEPMTLPDNLGTLSAREGTGMIQVASVAGDCDRIILAGYADISLEFSEEAEPFADVLRYELRVDGERAWRFHDVSYAPSVEERLGASSLGPGKDRLYSPCTPQPRLSAMPVLELGPHRVRMVGILPDDTEIESDEITVDLRCDGPMIAPAPNGAPRDDEVPLRAASPNCSTTGPGAGAGTLSSAGTFCLLLMAAGWIRRARSRCSDVRQRRRAGH